MVYLGNLNGVSAVSLVEHLDVSEERGSGVISIAEAAALKHLRSTDQ